MRPGLRMMKAKQNPKTRWGDTGEMRWDISGSLQSTVARIGLQKYSLSATLSLGTTNSACY
jgi:hypothetical protein